MVEGQRTRISVEPVNVRTLTGDILVVPTATDGHIGPPWDEILRDLAIPTTHGEMSLGGMDVQSAPPDAPVRFLAYVGTLDRRIGRGDPDVLERIGQRVGELSHREKEPMTLLAALAGAGFVELDAAAVLTALIRGFAATARPDAHLRFAIDPPHVWDQLKGSFAKIADEAGVQIEIAGTQPAEPDPRLEDVVLTSAARESVAYAHAFAQRRAMPPQHGVDAITMMLGTFARSRHSGGVTAAFLAWLAAQHPDAPKPEAMMRLIASAATIDEFDTTGVVLDQPSPDPTAGDLLADAVAIAQDLREVSLRKRHLLAAALTSLTDEEAALTGTGLPASALRAGLLEVLTTDFPDEPHERWADVLRAGPPPASKRRAAVRLVAGFYADAINRDRLVGATADPLRIRGDVDVLASVIASSRTKPPLSLGIFGDWGAGKSYLMNQVRLRVEQLAKWSREPQAGESYYCCQIVQIEFNAWQYVEGQLWASMVNRVFEGLRDHLGSEYQGVLDRIAEQDTAVQRARARLLDAESAVQAAEAPPPQQTVEEFENRHPDIKAAADELTNALGLDKEAISLGQVATQVEQLGTLTGRVRSGWSRRSRAQWLMLSGVAVLALVAFAGATWLPPVEQWLLRVGAVLAPILVLASQILTIGNRALRSGVRILGARDSEIEQFVDAAKEYDKARRRLDQLRAEGPGALYDFVSERYTAEDYRKYLGMLPLIRADLERLATHTDGRDGRRGIERIVLYIDDLDRCPSDQVVKVLEAVNLLFGFPLFVVVVAVDSRWLVHSLRHEYAHVFDGVSGIAPTPQDYLEKIIQIPFWLQPMTPEGFGRLVSSLVQPEADTARAVVGSTPGGGVGAEQSASPGQAEPGATAAPAGAASSGRAGRTDGGGPASTVVPEGAAAEPVPDLTPETLVMSPEELAFISDLAPLVHTPRATKRLVNTYQLVRVSVDDVPAFLAAEEYQPLLVLLALVTGTFGLTAAMVRTLLDSGASDLPTYLEKLRPSARDEGSRGWQRLRPDLQQIPADSVTVEAVRRWLPVVSRFSFQSGISLGIELAST